MNTAMRQVGRCGNCGGWVWSDQDYVEWEGFVPIHSDCWDEETPESQDTDTDRSGRES